MPLGMKGKFEMFSSFHSILPRLKFAFSVWKNFDLSADNCKKADLI